MKRAPEPEGCRVAAREKFILNTFFFVIIKLFSISGKKTKHSRPLWISQDK